MNDNMEAGADIHAGDGGYRLGTREGYDAFVKKRNPMNERIRALAHEAGLPTYNPEGVPTKLEKFAELIVKECMEQLSISNVPAPISAGLNLGKVAIKEHFGVKE